VPDEVHNRRGRWGVIISHSAPDYRRPGDLEVALAVSHDRPDGRAAGPAGHR